MAKTANEEILDATVRHQIKLLRFSQGEAQLAASLLAESDAELVKLLQSGLTETSEARIRSLLTEVRRLREAAAERIQEKLEKDMEGLASTEVQWETAMLEAATPVVMTFNSVPPAVLKAVASSPINGIPLAGWLGKMAMNDVARVEQQLRLGILQGETIDQMVRRIRGSKAAGYKDGVLDITRREAEMIARTATNHVSTAARQATWEANADVIQGVRWVSSLDGRTSPVCQSRDGEVYPIDKGPRPPAHPNCRSTVSPVLYGEAIVGDRPYVRDARTRRQREIDFRAEAKAEAGTAWKGMTEAERRAAIKARRDKWTAENIGQVPSTTNYQTWLKGQSKEFQDEVLGKGKAELFRQGLPLDKFVDERGKPYSLAQLRAELEGDKLHVLQPGVGLKAKSLLQQGFTNQEVLDQIKKEFPEASTSLASIASYKSELNKAGALSLPSGGKVPASALLKAKSVAEVVADLDSSLPANLKHALGGQWATVVDDLDGMPGAYGYYQAGKGVMLSGQKLAVLPAVQARQIAAHELGHLLHKQHDLTLDPAVLDALKASAKGLSPDARKLYSYYLSSADELVAEVYAQALSPSPLTSQGLSALQFNQAFGPAIDAAKASIAKKFPTPPPAAKPPLPGGPVLPYEVAGKHTSVGSLAKALLQQGMPDDQVLKSVLAEFPTAQTKLASIQSYKSQLKKQGLLPNKAAGPVVVPKPIPDVVPAPPQASIVAPSTATAAPSSVVLTSAQLKAEAIKLMNQGVLSNKDIAEALAKQFPANLDKIKLPNIATWKTHWKKASGGSAVKAAEAKAAAAAVKEATVGPIVKPKLYGVTLGPTSMNALNKVKSVLLTGGAKDEAYAAMKSVFGTLSEPGASDLLELAKYQVATFKSASKPYLNATFQAPAGFAVNPKVEQFIAKLDPKQKAALDAYKQAKAKGLGPINTNKLVKKLAGYEPSASAKVKLKEAAAYELKKMAPAAKPATPGFKPAAKPAPAAVDMTPARPASTPREGLPPPPRFTAKQREVGIRRFSNLPTSGFNQANIKQRANGLPELTLEEFAAVKAYTGNAYKVLNIALRDNKYSADPHLQAFVEAAQHGLAKMPKYVGRSTRGMTMEGDRLKAFLSTYRKGAIVEDSAFVSSSTGTKAAFKGNVYMRIIGKSGVDVDWMSIHQGEREVLFMPGTRFKVDNVEFTNGVYFVDVTEV